MLIRRSRRGITAAGLCHNRTNPTGSRPMLGVRMTQGKRLALWLLLAALTALLTYYAFRGYLSPAFLFDFSNSFSC